MENEALKNLATTPMMLLQPTPLTPAVTPFVAPVTDVPEKNGEVVPKQTLIEVPSDEVGRVETKIDNLPYYHGFMGRSECESMLSDHGDFLIRMTEIGKRIAYVISVRWNKKNVHILVKRTKTVSKKAQKWIFYFRIFSEETLLDANLRVQIGL